MALRHSRESGNPGDRAWGLDARLRVVWSCAFVLPAWVPVEHVLSLLLVVLVCVLIGVVVRTAAGRTLRERLETALFDRLPGYTLVRSLAQQLAGNEEEHG